MTQTITVEARLAWALIWMGVVLFVGVLLFGTLLQPHVAMINEVTREASTQDSVVNQGLNPVEKAVELWPLWFGLGLLYYGYRRAINESKHTPGGAR